MDGGPSFLLPGEHPTSRRRWLRLTISSVLTGFPTAERKAWLKNAPLTGEAARTALVERLAHQIEHQFEVRWPGDDVADPSLPEPRLRIPPPA